MASRKEETSRLRQFLSKLHNNVRTYFLLAHVVIRRQRNRKRFFFSSLCQKHTLMENSAIKVRYPY